MHAIVPHAAMIALLALSGMARAELPPPTPEQQQAAAEKKAKADAQTVEEKRQLATSMDTLADRWRKRASTEGWNTHPPVPVTAAKDSTTAAPPVKSEKSGTAPPSEDVKPDKPVSIR